MLQPKKLLKLALVAEVAPAPSELEAQSSDDDDDDELPPGEAVKRKHKRELVTADFTEEEEQEMVDWLQAAEQEYPSIRSTPTTSRRA